MKATRLLRGGSAAVVAGIAAWSSYSHMVHVALRYGERPEVAYALPFSVDGMLVVASMVMVDDQRQGRRVRPVVRVAFLAGVAASIGANIAAAHPVLGARVVAAWPAVALLLVVEMLAGAGRRQDLAADAKGQVPVEQEDAPSVPDSTSVVPVPSVPSMAAVVPQSSLGTDVAAQDEAEHPAVARAVVPPVVAAGAVRARLQSVPRPQVGFVPQGHVGEDAAVGPDDSVAGRGVAPSTDQPVGAQAGSVRGGTSMAGPDRTGQVPPRTAASGGTGGGTPGTAGSLRAGRRAVDVPDGTAVESARQARRPAAVTRELVSEILAAEPGLSRKELAARVGISARRLRAVLSDQPLEAASG